jgi:cell division protein FtsA
MKQARNKNLIAGLDVGTSKVLVVVGERREDGGVEIVASGTHPARGLKRGIVVDIETTAYSIQHAIEAAELMAGAPLSTVYVGVAGAHIRGINSHGNVAIHHSEVGPRDVDRVLDAARAVAIPADQQVLHVIEQEFILDRQDGIRDPVGMTGVRLDARVHIVTAAATAVQCLEKCAERCGLEVAGFVLEQYASAFAVLTDDDLDRGVCLLDIGAGSADLAVFRKGAIQHTRSLETVSGDVVTNHLALWLRTSSYHAEELKIRHGAALVEIVPPHETVEVPSGGERSASKLSRQNLAAEIRRCYEYFYELVATELRESGWDEALGAGFVLTGGAAKMEGAVELAEEFFHAPVRLGLPTALGGLSDVVSNPAYATGVGLVAYAAQLAPPPRRARWYARRSSPSAGAPLWSRLRGWFEGHF